MAFQLALVRPFLPGVTDPGSPDVSADRNGFFRVTTSVGIVGEDSKGATLTSSGLAIPPDHRSIDVTFKYFVDYQATSWCFPGPGYASAFIQLGFLIIPTVTGEPGRFEERRKVLAHSLTPIVVGAPLADRRAESEMIPVRLGRPTIVGERWFFSMHATALSAGVGIVAGARAEIQGTLEMIVVEGR
jgi:hypothetical protein